MKKLLVTATATLACVAAFAQGRITFQNDSLHLVYFTTDTSMLETADLSLAGQATAKGGVLASGGTLTADLWGGTSSTSLTLQKTTTFNTASEGTIQSANFVSANLAGGTPAYFQVQIYSTAAGSYANALAGKDLYYGESSIFTTVPSTSTLAYNSIVNHGGQALSTWANGTQAINNTTAYGNGALGAIAIQANVPEPTSLALLGLGAAGMMIFRRRK